jgi:hypothetical protein
MPDRKRRRRLVAAHILLVLSPGVAALLPSSHSAFTRSGRSSLSMPTVMSGTGGASDDNDDGLLQRTCRSIWRDATLPIPAALLDEEDERPPSVYPGYREEEEEEEEEEDGNDRRGDALSSSSSPPPVLRLVYFSAPFAGLIVSGESSGGAAVPYLVCSAAFVGLAASVRVPQWSAAAAAALVSATFLGGGGGGGGDDVAVEAAALGAGVVVAAAGALGGFEDDDGGDFNGDAWFDEKDNDRGGGGGDNSRRLEGAPFEELDRLEVFDDRLRRLDSDDRNGGKDDGRNR